MYESIDCFDQIIHIVSPSFPQQGLTITEQTNLKVMFLKGHFADFFFRVWLWLLEPVRWKRPSNQNLAMGPKLVLGRPLGTFELCWSGALKLLLAVSSAVYRCHAFSEGQFHPLSAVQEETRKWWLPAVTLQEWFQGFGQGSCTQRDRSPLGKPGRKERGEHCHGGQIGLSRFHCWRHYWLVLNKCLQSCWRIYSR